jgi:hypothetical protein
MVRQPPSLCEALGINLNPPDVADADDDAGPWGCYMRPPGENGPEFMTGEALRRPMVGKPNE